MTLRPFLVNRPLLTICPLPPLVPVCGFGTTAALGAVVSLARAAVPRPPQSECADCSHVAVVIRLPRYTSPPAFFTRRNLA